MNNVKHSQRVRNVSHKVGIVVGTNWIDFSSELVWKKSF